ncbi:MAG: PAS domain-containing protein [Bryobacterales bacterium]|nr:PAS domain-containing protein [Acidobacteriota bacterium]MCB9383349.1 PAS domain-containing protein [Bryobacterales bacterium]
MRPKVAPTGVEQFFGEDEIIVSKTDLKGKITYANEVFMRIAGYSEEELLGAPHNIIRHPDMPRCVFKLLWDQIEAGREIFAYVVNQCKNGDHYWVYAHVTPTFGPNGEITGYHSNRRVPERDAVEKATGLYRQLRAIEERATSQREGMQAATEALGALLGQQKVDYDEFVFTL